MGPGGGHGRGGHPGRDPGPGQVGLGHGQRLPNRPGQRRRHPVRRPDHPPHQAPQLRRPPPGRPPGVPALQPRPSWFGPPEGERSRGADGVLLVVHSPRAGLRRLDVAGVVRVVLGADQGGQEGDQAQAVEGGVVAGDRQPGPARPGHHPEGGLGGQVEAGDQVGGGERVVVDDQRLGGRARMPGLTAEAGPGHRHRPVQGGQPLLEPVHGRVQGRRRDHRPGGPPVGEAQQGQRVGRGRRRQPLPAAAHPVPGPAGPPPGSSGRPRNRTVGEQIATRRASASSGRHHGR